MLRRCPRADRAASRTSDREPPCDVGRLAPLQEPDGDTSTLIQTPVTDSGLPYAKASDDFKFAAAVAGYGMILRNSPHKGTATLDAVLELADEGKGKDDKGYRADFLDLVKKTKALIK